ncbi:MAG: hypothetical protein IK014_12680 [Lachnospiraceae bacterium]|nr:hypothetical protein [Lachnospiraceae bacterium]
MRDGFFLDMLPLDYEPKHETITWGPETENVLTEGKNRYDMPILILIIVAFCALLTLTLHDIFVYKDKRLDPTGRPKVSQKRIMIDIIIDIVFAVGAVLYFVIKG